MPVIKLFSLVQLIGSITFILPVSITVKYQVHIYYWYLFSFTFGTPSPTRPAPSFFLEKCEKIHESINTLENITNPFYKSRGLPLHWRNWPPKVFRVASMACPPIFYIMAAEKEKMKTIFKAFFSRSDSKNIFKCVRPSDWASVQSRGRQPLIWIKFFLGEVKQQWAQYNQCQYQHSQYQYSQYQYQWNQREIRDKLHTWGLCAIHACRYVWMLDFKGQTHIGDSYGPDCSPG